jgi:PKD repeat protein
MAALLTTFALVAAAALVAGRTHPSSAATPPLVVSVAYADTHHGSNGRFPSPWAGAPGVTFVGTAQRWDAGAVRLDNPASSAVTASVSVDIGKKHFALWPANLSVPAGGTLILTETKSGNFDTSELSSPGPCTAPSSVVPLVNVTVGGTKATYRDTTQVLNTGGVDAEKCPPGTDESHGWQQLDAPVPIDAPPVARLAVTPASGTAPLTVTADASASTDTDATPIASYRFDFGDGTIVGPQPAATTGHAYASVGAFTVTVTVTDTAGGSTTTTAPVTVLGFPSFVINGHDAATAAAGAWNLLDVGTSTVGNVPVGSGVAGIVWLGDLDNSTCTFALDDASVTSTVAAHRGDARVFAYYIADEPDASTCANAPALLQARTALVHAADPAARTFSVFSEPATFASFVPTVDIPATDPYPCKPSQPCDTTMIPAYAAAMRATGATKWWGVLQGFGSGSWRWPTGAEMHAMIRQWCGAGWSGAATFAWTWNGEQLADHPDVLQQIRTLDTAGCASFTDDAPVAALTVSPASGAAPLAVTADASASTDTDATPIASYAFDWGDSTSSGPQAGATAGHTYPTAGAYTATVTVTDTAGLSATRSVAVRATVGPPVDAPPVAALTVSPASGAAPLAVTADASASTDTDATPIASYAFDWGDGTSSGPQAGATAGHTYATAGSYTAKVTVTDTAGLSATATAAVAAGGNLVGNPGFETGTTGWNVILTGTTLERVAGGHSGGWSARLSNTGTSSTTLGLNDSPNWVTTTKVATPYTLSIWVRADTPGAVVKLKVREYTGSTNVGSASANIALTTSWQQVSLSYSPVAGGSSSLDFQAYVSSAPPGSSFSADDAAIVAG